MEVHTENLHIHKNEYSVKAMIYIFLIPLIFFALVIVGYFVTLEFHGVYQKDYMTTSQEGGDFVE